jgi:aflatoxin B1 aldehyde reductase
MAVGMNLSNAVLGTMTFGPQVDSSEALRMMEVFRESGGLEIDTAYVYNEGETEKILGNTLERFPAGTFRIATKVNPRVTGTLDRESITMQLEESLRRLRLESVDVLYLHFPDPSTSIKETLKACAELHQAGKFKELGLSNFPAWMVADIWHVCGVQDWVRPSVYQGLYNALSRKVEPELLPALRHLGVRLYTYNPLAGGLLTGKHTSYRQEPTEGRFSLRVSYRNRYWKESFFKAVEIFVSTCLEEDIAPAAASLRWLTYHSHLDTNKGDRVIVGASSLNQLNQNLNALSSQKLPESVVEALDAAWEQARSDSPEYFRSVTG